MNLTSFESEIIDSLLWQIRGFKEGHVSERATNRVLRASLRRVKHRLAGFSAESSNALSTNNDHAVPVKVVVKMLIDTPELTKDAVLEVLNKFYVSVVISEHEHTSTLKDLGLESEMPENWDGIDPFARYKHARIEIISES